MTTLNAEEIRKLDSLISEAVSMKDRHKVEQDGIKEAIKALADSTGLKVKNINKSIAIAFKASFQEAEEDGEEVIHILQSVGRM